MSRWPPCDDERVIVVVGEALVDLVVDRTGDVTATLGGGPFNTARACGRLGAAVSFAGVLSTDRFGSLLAERLVDDGVRIDRVQRTDAPTTLAIAEIDAGGAASYRFYVDGTSAASFDGDITGLAPNALFTGGLALVLEPMADAVETIVGQAAGECMVMVDLNVRPQAITDRARYLARLERILERADVVKASDDDLRHLWPEWEPARAARELSADGARAVLLTAGGGAARVITGGADVAVPVPPVDVVDTIGAGDSFCAGFLTCWTERRHTAADLRDPAALHGAAQAGVAVASITCTRRGADPPRRDELPGGWC